RPVARQIGESLERLGLDAADAFVLHGVRSLEQWDELARPGGGWGELEACRAQGGCRFVGISAHDPAALRAALTSNKLDIALFPVGPYVDTRYVDEILPLARTLRVGTVCFKTFGAGKLLGDTEGYGRPLANRPRGKLSSGGAEESSPTLPRLSVSECVHYTLTLDPDVALLGMSFPNEQDAALAAAESFQPLSAEAMASIRERAAHAIAHKGPCWWNPPDAAFW